MNNDIIGWDSFIEAERKKLEKERIRKLHWARSAYHFRYDTLRKKLGEKCAQCGSEKNLEFDHPNGRDWQPNMTNSIRRLIKYEKDYLNGNLRLLCKTCNAIDGGVRSGIVRNSTAQ